jgi:uncharacterized membrane protein YpjA
LKFSFFWSESFLLNRKILWLLLGINGLGTIYGYQWYSWQISYTLQEKAMWLVWFVPDSPTASLFFTLTIIYLLRDQYRRSREQNKGVVEGSMLRGVLEALAVITSIKYGIWAVVMIVAGNMQGDPFQWQHAMLITSHLGMAVEAALFARFFTYRTIHIVIAASWTLCNDVIDYRFGVFPSLPKLLHDFLPIIKIFTFALSLVCIVFTYMALKLRLSK